MCVILPACSVVQLLTYFISLLLICTCSSVIFENIKNLVISSVTSHHHQHNHKPPPPTLPNQFISIRNTSVMYLHHSKRSWFLTFAGQKIKIRLTTICCRIDLRAIEPVSNGLIFRPLYRMVVRFMLGKNSISLYVITKEEKKPGGHSIVSDSEVYM